MNKNKKTQNKATPKPSKKNQKKQRQQVSFASLRNLDNSIIRAPRPGMSDAERYKLAQLNPFHPDAVGCRVPDFESVPTISEHWRGSIRVTSSATGGISMLMRPSMGYMFNMVQGSLTSNLAYAVDSSNLQAPLTDSVVAGVYKSFRLVSAGFRVSNLMNFSTVAGRMVATPIVLASLKGNQTAISAVGAGIATALLASEGLSGTANPWQLMQPGSKKVNLDQLINQNLGLLCRPCANDAHNFYHSDSATDPAGASGQLLQGDEWYSAAGAVSITSADAETINCSGWNGWLLYADGLPNSTVICEIEVILHLEGRPTNAQNAGASLVPSIPQPDRGGGPSWQSVMTQIRGFDISRMMPPDTVMQGLGSLMGGMVRGATMPGLGRRRIGY